MNLLGALCVLGGYAVICHVLSVLCRLRSEALGF